ncbi:ATP-binding cassette domain-containing protein [Acetivibrio sp. MSJd-27]|uniref:ABC transporter ATP-binding protein n=1 Tax=Acetivibrio sp. MSJd-27 TaxID=2841523 RepID=UPI001C106C6F|nr:ATP-binding cassette domain-containing protein [Acetivibrio sp. MSJd-27]MBU5450195.1 ATP-binding cassette domain-containing protein [Acetivibrio sp. MSJd-27]
MIELKNINKTFRVVKKTSGAKEAFKAMFHREYKEIEALKDLSLKVNEGEIVGYIGPNGAGKSTSIKVMSGILTPDSGECSIMGYTPWKDRRRYVKNIGVVFGQRSQLWWDVPVMDSFLLLKDIYNVPEKTFRENVDMLTEMLNLNEFINQPLRQLSLGQKMRAEIAGSLLHNPQLLFLDEPTIGLDATTKLSVRNFIKTINKEKGTTIMLTTHDMNDIDAITDRVVLIGKGRILYDGSFEQIKKKYGNNKTLTVSFENEAEPIEISGAVLTKIDRNQATYTVDTGTVSIAEIINRLSEKTQLTDVDVKSQAIEEIVASLYEHFNIK